jgi:hypothetical protein
LAAAALAFTGCSSLDTYEPVFDRYYSTTLKLSTSSDVLAMIQDPETEMVSQSDSVIASWGVEGKKDRTHWFNMVAFDEEQMNAVRKYGFILEETQGGWNQKPEPALRLDAAYVMDEDLLEAPYASNNEKRIELLKAAREHFGNDAQDLVLDSQSFRNSTIMVKQALNRVLIKLEQSPAYAAKLPLIEGMTFDHPTLGEAHIRMLIEDDIVKIKIKAGKAWFKKGWILDDPFEEHPDVNYM